MLPEEVTESSKTCQRIYVEKVNFLHPVSTKKSIIHFHPVICEQNSDESIMLRSDDSIISDDICLDIIPGLVNITPVDISVNDKRESSLDSILCELQASQTRKKGERPMYDFSPVTNSVFKKKYLHGNVDSPNRQINFDLVSRPAYLPENCEQVVPEGSEQQHNKAGRQFTNGKSLFLFEKLISDK